MNQRGYAKNLRTRLPIALTTSWQLIFTEKSDRSAIFILNTGGDTVYLNTNKTLNPAATQPDEEGGVIPVIDAAARVLL